MPEMMLNRDYVLSTLKGHRIAFRKDTPTYVPNNCVVDATAIGAQFLDGTSHTPEEVPSGPAAPDDASMKKQQVFAAFHEMVDRGNRDDFTAAGQPNKYAVDRILGWSLDMRDRNKYWEMFKTEQGSVDN